MSSVPLSNLGTRLYLQLQKLDLKGKPLARLIDRLNTRWLRMSAKVARGAIAHARERGADRIFCGHTHDAMHLERDGVHYYNAGGWIDERLTYITIEETRRFASMTTTSELTIVIPAKNEAKLIPNLLQSLATQDYSKMSSTKVLVADANSTDGTPDIVLGFRDRLNVGVIGGGMPAVGRNRGAALADSTYVLFLDADIEMAHPSVIRRAVELAQQKQLHCVTTNIVCRDGSWFDKAMYAGNDFFQYLSRWHKPFATGMFMLFDREKSANWAAFTSRRNSEKTTC